MVHFGWFCPPVDIEYSPGHAAIQVTMCGGTNYYADYGITSIGGKDCIGTDDDIKCWHFPHKDVLAP